MNAPIKTLAVINHYLDLHQNTEKAIPYLQHLSDLRRNIVEISGNLSTDIMNSMTEYKNKFPKDQQILKHKYYYLTTNESILQAIDAINDLTPFKSKYTKLHLSSPSTLPKCKAEHILQLQRTMKSLNLPEFQDHFNKVAQQLQLSNIKYKKKIVFIQPHNRKEPASWNRLIKDHINEPSMVLKVSKTKRTEPSIIVYNGGNKTKLTNMDYSYLKEYFINHDDERSKRELNKIILWYFFADWCVYCKEFDVVWKEFQIDDNFSVEMRKVDGTKMDPEMKKEFKVVGFPTIVLQKPNGIIHYEGERTAEKIKTFIKENADTLN